MGGKNERPLENVMNRKRKEATGKKTKVGRGGGRGEASVDDAFKALRRKKGKNARLISARILQLES